MCSLAIFKALQHFVLAGTHVWKLYASSSKLKQAACASISTISRRIITSTCILHTSTFPMVLRITCMNSLFHHFLYRCFLGKGNLSRRRDLQPHSTKQPLQRSGFDVCRREKPARKLVRKFGGSQCHRLTFLVLCPAFFCTLFFITAHLTLPYQIIFYLLYTNQTIMTPLRTLPIRMLAQIALFYKSKKFESL